MRFIIENVISDSDSVKLVSTDGPVLTMSLHGGCCSRSYFDAESTLDAESLLGERLMSVEYNKVAGEPTPDVEDTKNYALILRTDRQSISMLWRNDSNGYYSGSVSFDLDGDHFYDDGLREFLK